MAQTTTVSSSINWIAPLKESCQASLLAAAVFSGVANFLMLVPAFFMLSVYDKAIGANSLPTLAVHRRPAGRCRHCRADVQVRHSCREQRLEMASRARIRRVRGLYRTEKSPLEYTPG